ncbi:MAG: hypothetical protein NUV49_02935, partial [Patescibacteria group bacterium]|nr:hypothetical protein [Patescibacteria group bacterium]
MNSKAAALSLLTTYFNKGKPMAYIKSLVILLVFFVVSTSPCSAAGVPLFHGGAASSAIVVEDGLHSYAAKELQRYLAKLGGATVPIITPSQAKSIPKNTSLIFVGGPKENALVGDMVKDGLVNFEELGQDGFILRSGSFNKHEVVVVGGNNEAATLYAVYDVLQRLGAVFLLSKDILPAVQPDLTLPYMDVRQVTPFSRRGVFISNIYLPRSIMHLSEVKQMIDNMAKLKLNYLQW